MSNYRHPRGLQRAQLASLVTSDWVRQRQSLLIVGPTGCGKTWLACALGNAACRQGLSVQYPIAPPCSVYILGHPSPKTPALGGEYACGGPGRPASVTTRHTAARHDYHSDSTPCRAPCVLSTPALSRALRQNPRPYGYPGVVALASLHVLLLRATRLLDDLRIAHADGSYSKKLAHLAKLDLLILDDWGLQKLTHAQAQDLLEVIDDRHGVRSLLITSQIPIEHWHDTLGDPTLADAILDRVCHSAHKLLLTGESMRKNTKTLTDRDHLD